MPPRSSRNDLAGEHKAAQQQNGFANRNPGKSRAPYGKESRKAAYRRRDTHEQGNVGEGARGLDEDSEIVVWSRAVATAILPLLAGFDIGLDLMWTGVVGGTAAYAFHRWREATT